MRFGEVLLSEAEGAVLAHSMEASRRPYTHQFSYRIPKGTVLTREHLEDLAEEGHQRITVAQLETGDIPENAAATALAQALAPQAAALGLRIASPGAGRVNLYAAHAGVVGVDRAKIDAVNAVDPMITIATVPPFHRVDANGMIATIKIIAYSVTGAALEAAAQDAQGALRVLPPVYASATLIETITTREVPPDKGRAAMAGRLARMGMMLSDRVIVPHDTEAIAEAIRSAPGDVVFILTASATSDPQDVGPEALRRAGGHVEAFGMPVDPGNLLFFGDLDGKPVIGLPGCARSPALNGADWVLERLICGIPVRQADIAAMGVGGLLKEIPTRPQPRRSGE